MYILKTEKMQLILSIGNSLECCCLLIEHKFVPEVKTPFVFSTGKLILTTIYKPLKTDKQ